MENNNFKIRIIDFYKEINKPIIDKMITDDSFKNILDLSSISEIQLLKKEKNNWYLKDKNKILKEIETRKKTKMKEIKRNLSKINIIKINDIKENNNKLFSDLETIDLLKNNIENDTIYNNIKKLSLLSNNIELTKKRRTHIFNIEESESEIKSEESESEIKSEESKKCKESEEKNKFEIIKINLNNYNILNISSDSNDFIEIFSN